MTFQVEAYEGDFKALHAGRPVTEKRRQIEAALKLAVVKPQVLRGIPIDEHKSMTQSIRSVANQFDLSVSIGTDVDKLVISVRSKGSPKGDAWVQAAKGSPAPTQAVKAVPTPPAKKTAGRKAA